MNLPADRMYQPTKYTNSHKIDLINNRNKIFSYHHSGKKMFIASPW